MPVKITRLPVSRPATEFLVEVLADEVLVYDQANHRAHCLSPAAALVWGLCDGGPSDRARAALLAAGCAETVEAVVTQLVAAGLVVAPRSSVNLRRRRMLRTTAVAAGVIVASPVLFSIVSPSVAEAASCGKKTQSCCSTAPRCNPTLRCTNGFCQ